MSKGYEKTRLKILVSLKNIPEIRYSCNLVLYYYSTILCFYSSNVINTMDFFSHMRVNDRRISDRIILSAIQSNNLLSYPSFYLMSLRLSIISVRLFPSNVNYRDHPSKQVFEMKCMENGQTS